MQSILFILFICSFLCVSKEMNQRKDSPITYPPAADPRSSLQSDGGCGTRPLRRTRTVLAFTHPLSVSNGCVRRAICLIRITSL